MINESKLSQATDAVYIHPYSFNISIMAVSSGLVRLTNTHGLLRPEHCVESCCDLTDSNSQMNDISWKTHKTTALRLMTPPGSV